MIPQDYKLEVSATNGRPQRTVLIKRADGISFRDQINTTSSTSRKRLIGNIAEKFGGEPADFVWVEDEVCNASDQADDAADDLVGEPEEHRSTADLIVDLALARYRIGRTETDEAFAVELNGPNIALMFRGSRDALRSALSCEFRRLHGRTPNSSALTDALTALQGEANEAEPEAVHLRVAEHDGQFVIDIGDTTGRAIVVRPGGWEVADRAPVLFRRTAATGILPVPISGGTLNELRPLLNVSDATWPLLVGWLVSALVPSIPHPILLLGGQQGSGKSTAARAVIGVIDPSPAQLRSQPRDVEAWAVAANASWAVAIDNISTIPAWWSDSLCKAVTGDGWLRRKLYTDGDLAVLSFRRVMLLTSIDAGALRGDLGERVVLVDLEPIPDTVRLTERELWSHYDAARPRVFGALLDLLAKAMAALPQVHLERQPRMADFGRWLAAVDLAADVADDADNLSLNIYLAQRSRIAETVIESDPVALAIEELLEKEPEWHGTASQLLARILPAKSSHDWPQTPQGMGGRLRRLIPALEQAGIRVEQDRAGHQRTRMYHLSKRQSVTDGKHLSALSAEPDEPGIPEVKTRTTGADDLSLANVRSTTDWSGADEADVADVSFDNIPDVDFTPRPATLRGLCTRPQDGART